MADVEKGGVIGGDGGGEWVDIEPRLQGEQLDQLSKLLRVMTVVPGTNFQKRDCSIQLDTDGDIVMRTTSEMTEVGDGKRWWKYAGDKWRFEPDGVGVWRLGLMDGKSADLDEIKDHDSINIRKYVEEMIDWLSRYR